MPKFRKKPLVIEATRLTRPVLVETLEGYMSGKPGDWLITGVRGEQYVCRKAMFENAEGRALIARRPSRRKEERCPDIQYSASIEFPQPYAASHSLSAGGANACNDDYAHMRLPEAA